MIYKLCNINNDFNGYSTLINMYTNLKSLWWDNIEISFENVTFISANIGAMAGALFTKLKESNNLTLINIAPKVEKALSQNEFLSYFGFPVCYDYYNTTIPYKVFDMKDSRYFTDYINRRLLLKEAMPEMNTELKNKFSEGLLELFSNAQIHSETKDGIFVCGQFFPQKEKIEFTIVDLGIGMKNKINKEMGCDFDSVEAIQWAMDSNTTKKDAPGGLGLQILRNFVFLNGGKIQIVSNSGYCLFNKDNTIEFKLDNEFPGTVVNIEINTNDTNTYSLEEENLENIF